jgi:hypothetical protein
MGSVLQPAAQVGRQPNGNAIVFHCLTFYQVCLTFSSAESDLPSHATPQTVELTALMFRWFTFAQCFQIRHCLTFFGQL